MVRLLLGREEMDRNTWMYEIGHATSEFIDSLDEFITIAETDQLEKGNTTISCPCKKCKNARWYTDSTDIKNYLIAHGFMRGYTCWSFHGESLADLNPSVSDNDTDNEEDSYNSDNNVNFDDMFNDLDMEDNVADKYHDRLQQLFVDAEKPLYTGCMNFTELPAVIQQVNLKSNNGWSDTSFISLLELLNKMLPEGNELPVSTYQAKKLMCPMGLKIQRIHACPNDCMLYKNEDKDLHQCKVCGTSSTKGKKACPVCEENTHSIWLTNCKKLAFMGHRRELAENHPYRKKSDLFDGTIEDRKLPPPLDGEATLSKVANINVVLGKKGLLLNIPGKTKDGIKVRRDMKLMNIRPELQPKDIDGRATKFLLPACYTMSKVEKTKFCQCLHGIKVPSGYSANIRKLVSMKDLK
ncbi:uncharacterized protein [Rutidosis leptorrhynchoides]|uniref:uncharacterized protein n=1 Tax=Rutidosis leptorrhynchoides TaxID=125765 RepID=UPI003A9A3C33